MMELQITFAVVTNSLPEVVVLRRGERCHWHYRGEIICFDLKGKKRPKVTIFVVRPAEWQEAPQP